MTKAELIDLLNEREEDENIDLNELAQEEARYQAERRAELIEEIEERQHNSGFYTFQDLMEMRRLER